MSNPFLPGAIARDITSSAGHAYRIFIWRPETPAGEGRLPVVYLLDGNASFPIAVTATALQSRRAERTGVRPAIIVGIGYPTSGWLDAERRTCDYTPRVPPEALPQRPGRSGWSTTGGADAFLGFIADELKPMIEQEFGGDPAQSTLFGHSFGGLFVLHALFTRPELFRHHVAASPSIWFGADHLAAARQRFDAQGRRLLITVGSLEQSEAQAPDGSSADYDSWIRRNRMVENARALAADLKAMKCDVTYTEFADENHASVLPAAISRALRFALAPEVGA
jgi:uncharacterized protein